MTRKVRTYTKSINTEGDAPFVYRVVAVSTIVNVLDIEDLKFTRQLTCAFAYKLMIRYEIMTKWNVIGRTRCETGVYEQRLAKKQLVRNKWFSFTISDSKNFFDSLFRNSESRNKFFLMTGSNQWIKKQSFCIDHSKQKIKKRYSPFFDSKQWIEKQFLWISDSNQRIKKQLFWFTGSNQWTKKHFFH